MIRFIFIFLSSILFALPRYSLQEATSFMACHVNPTGAGMRNDFGSNIFDICIGIGLPVLIYSIIYKPVEMNMPIDRVSLFNLGDYIFNGSLLIWSLFILFIFTLLTSIIYY